MAATAPAPSRASRRFSVAVHRRMCGAVLVMAVTGTVGVAAAPEFEDRLRRRVRSGRFRRLVIDLSGVGFISAEALSALVRVVEAAACLDRQVRIVPGGGASGRLTSAVGATLDLPLEVTLEQACELWPAVVSPASHADTVPHPRSNVG